VNGSVYDMKLNRKQSDKDSLLFPHIGNKFLQYDILVVLPCLCLRDCW